MSVTKKLRWESVDFLAWFYNFLKNNQPRDHYTTIDQLTKIESVLVAARDMISRFTSLDDANCEFHMDFQAITDNLRHIDQSTEEELISAIKHFLLTEYHYEAENNLLPGQNSNAIFSITKVHIGYIPRDNVVGYDNYSFDVTEKDVENQSIQFRFISTKNGRKTRRTIKVVDSHQDSLHVSIEPYARKVEEQLWLQYLVNKRLYDYASLTFDLDELFCEINNYISKIDTLIHNLRLTDIDNLEFGNLQEENSNFNPSDHIGGYSHRMVSIPIMGYLLGVELEFAGNVNAIFKFAKSLERLYDMGWILERDGSVDFELKSPIMDINEINRTLQENINLLKAWTILTDGDKAGLHFHVSMDDSFAINKKPNSKTNIFMVKLAQLLENKVFTDGNTRKVIFKRDYQSYCEGYGDNNDINRYRWINFLNLNRDYGKTIEIRLFSSSAASELDKAAERALLIAKLFKHALKDWRAKGRLEFSNWVKSFGDTKVFKALFSKEEIKRWSELFSVPIKSAKSA